MTKVASIGSGFAGRAWAISAKPREREAGGLFAVYGLGVRGLPEPRFAG
jgi:hypothetical protein